VPIPSQESVQSCICAMGIDLHHQAPRRNTVV